MTQPGTTAFRAARRRGTVDLVWLLRIDLTVPTSRTIRIATTEVDTPDGNAWEAGLEPDPITDGVEFMGPGPNLVTWRFGVVNRQFSFQSSGRFDSLLSAYQFKGARVRLYEWERSLTSFNDALQIFDGQISWPQAEPTRVTFDCSQSPDWDVTIPTKLVDRVNSPNAPDASMGLPYPIIGGSWKKPTLPSPFSAADIQDNDRAGGGRLAVPLILADPGLGAANVKAIAAGHLLKKIFNATDGHSAFLPGHDGFLAACDATGITETLGASESFLTVNDGQLIAYAGISPVAVVTNAFVNNTAQNPRNAMGPFEPSDFATIDQAAGATKLLLYLPDIPSLGIPLAVTAIVKVIFAGITTTAFRFYPENVSTGATGAVVALGAGQPANTLLTLTGAWDANAWNAQWQFGSGGAAPLAPGPMAIALEFNGGAGQKAYVYTAQLVVEYMPNRTMVNPQRMGVRPFVVPLLGKKGWALYDESGAKDVWFGSVSDKNHPGLSVRPFSPAVFQLNTPFFANVEGQPDNAFATFTGGAAGTLIERPCDLIRWMLVDFGGLDPNADFEIASGGHGSFVDARFLTREDYPESAKAQLYIGSQQKLSDAIKTLCSQYLATVFLDRLAPSTGSSVWRFGLWKRGAQPDYDLTFTWDMIDIVDVRVLADSDARQEVRMRYGFDYNSQRTLWESFVSPDGSTAGQLYPTWRDQKSITISAANNKVDFKVGGVTYAGTIANATYTRCMTLAQAVAAAMVGAAGADRIGVGYGFDILAGYNSAFTITFNGSNYTATLRDGSYSADELALEVIRSLSALGLPTTWGCTYDHSTNLFTITSSSALVWDIWDGSAPGYVTMAWATLGFISQTGHAGTTKTADDPMYADRYWIAARHYSAHEGVQILFGTGVNVAVAPVMELGYAPATDTVNLPRVKADYSRGMRENLASALAAQNGPRDPDTATLDAFSDETTVTRVRNRRFDLRGTDRVLIVYRTPWASDLQRLRAIQFSNDIDAHVAFPRYGSDGSWANKGFRVLSMTHYPPEQGFQEITAIEF